MKRLSSSVTLVLTVLAFFVGFVLLTPATANADYRDRSGDLPKDDNSTTTILIVAAVALAVGVLVYALLHKGGGDKDKADDDGEETEDTEKKGDEGEDSQSNLLNSPGLDGAYGQANGLLSDVRLYVGLDHEPASGSSTIALRAPGLSDYTVKVGFTFGL